MTSSVKMTNKHTLEQLSAKILLLTGKKFTQQELLDFCVDFSAENIDDLIKRIVSSNRKWNDDEINDLFNEFVDDFGEESDDLSERVDDILYGEIKD